METVRRSKTCHVQDCQEYKRDYKVQLIEYKEGKCDLVCANCHREIHQGSIQAWWNWQTRWI